MIHCNKLALVLATGLSLPFAASAKTAEQIYLDSCNKGAGVPVPISVVSPHIAPDDIGETVVLGFVVDAHGMPKNLKVQSGSDRELAAAAIEAVSRWRFAPVQRNGTPVETKVVLPIRVIERPKADGSLAFD